VRGEEHERVVEVRRASKVYHLGATEVHALCEVDLCIRAGDALAIMGPSGSGKSTLMHLIGCLDRPSSGEVIVEGASTSAAKDKRLAQLRGQTIGFVFQSFNLIPRISALQNVMLPMMFGAKIPKSKRAQRAKNLLERVGLGSRTAHMPNELSGGERQRVSIARALANDPTLLLADEPTGNLDTRTGRDILNLFKALHDEGRTLVLVTHDPNVASQVDRVVQLVDGKVQREGTDGDA